MLNTSSLCGVCGFSFRYTSRGSESTSNRGVVAMGSHPYNYLSTDHSLMPVSGDHGNMWILQYGPVAYKCNTFYITGAIGCYFKRTSSGIQAVTYVGGAARS